MSLRMFQQPLTSTSFSASQSYSSFPHASSGYDEAEWDEERERRGQRRS